MRMVPRYDMDTTERGGLVAPVHAPPPVRDHPGVEEARRLDPNRSLIGERIIVADPLHHVHDVRAVSDPYQDLEGHWVIDFVDERDYYLFHTAPDGYPGGKILTRRVDQVFVD